MNDDVERTVDVATLVVVSLTLVVAMVVAYQMYRNRNRDYKLVKSEEMIEEREHNKKA